MSSNNQLINKYLASCLLEAIVNENIIEVGQLLARKASPNLMVAGKGYASIHYCAGMENTEFSEKAMDLLLKNQGDPNVQTVLEQLTPLHIACMGGHSNIVLKLMKHGGDINVLDEDKITPIQYAIDESHYDIVMLIKNFLFEQKMEIKNSNLLKAMQVKSKSNHLLAEENLEDTKYTPNRRNYNFDITSPYYVNITHRRRDKYNKPSISAIEQESPITPATKALMESTRISTSAANLFDLTEHNLIEFTRVHNPNRTRDSLIDIWRNKVKYPTRTVMLQTHKDIDELLTEFLVEEAADSKCSSVTGSTVVVKNWLSSSVDSNSEMLNESFRTACNSENVKKQETEVDFIKSPLESNIVLQVAENYVHTDNEIGMVFYEEKILPSNLSKRILDANDTCSTLSTSFSVPSDYGTDELRNELTTFGHIPGPITKSTKRLYLKRLIKFKRSKDKMSLKIPAVANDITQNFSVELRKTLKSEVWFDAIDKHLDLEKEMFESIRNLPLRSLREGHLKTSFVYLLIDPRISDNLPGQYKFLAKSETWEKFLSSIFYVGKGKSSRPYSHLYEAIQYYNGLIDVEEKENCPIREFRKLALSNCDDEILFIDRDNQYLKTPPRQNDSTFKLVGNKKHIELTKKLDRIINIWQSKNGVVCLHLFHNITPTEAYTREASIIECLTLNHLTNKKGGDYYGITKTWTMRAKKHLGVGLLYRAMQTYLAQGESQLMPRDLL